MISYKNIKTAHYKSKQQQSYEFNSKYVKWVLLIHPKVIYTFQIPHFKMILTILQWDDNDNDDDNFYS